MTWNCFHSSYAKWWFTGCFSAVFRLWPLDQYLCTKCYRSVISVQSNKNKWQKPELELCIFALIGLGIYILLFKSIRPAKSEWPQMTSIMHCTVLPTTKRWTCPHRGNRFPLPPVYVLTVTVPKPTQNVASLTWLSSECGIRTFTLLSSNLHITTIQWLNSGNTTPHRVTPSCPEVTSKDSCMQYGILNHRLWFVAQGAGDMHMELDF